MNKILLTNIIIIVLLVVAIANQYITQKSLSIASGQRVHYFTANSDGTLTTILPLDDPYLSNGDLEKWVQKALMETFSLKNETYIDSLHSASRFYSARGWNSFTHFLQDENLVEHLKLAGCFITSKSSSFKIVSQEMKNGRYSWNVNVDLALNESSCGGSVQNKKLNLVLVRYGASSPQGVAIEDWKVSDAAK